MRFTAVRRLVLAVAIIGAIEVAYMLVVAGIFFGAPADPEVARAASWTSMGIEVLLVTSLLVLGTAVIRLAAARRPDRSRIPQWPLFAVAFVNAGAVVVGVWAALEELGTGELVWWTTFSVMTAFTVCLALWAAKEHEGLRGAQRAYEK